ncbi:MAG: putative type I restriction enzymeP M protein [Planctomycetes bacterium ADurb.Bin126]|nr:MAG: putative type I restriction enzymeP M protein [Planctomycetes bacterium ADurb.Bin126]
MASRKRNAQGSRQMFMPGFTTPKEVFRNLRNYLAGQFLGSTRDEVLLEELLKVLFCKLYAELGLAKPLDGVDGVTRAQNVRQTFACVRRDFSDIYGPDDELLLNPEAIDAILSQCAFSLAESESDPIGDAFEVFAGAESRGRSGQFFTPRQTTDFLVEAVAPTPGERIIDPACGAGGFLTSVVRRYAHMGVGADSLKQEAANLFGIDKDSYLVKLAKLHCALLSGGHPTISFADSIAFRGETDGQVLPELGSFDVVLTNPPFGTKIVAASADTLRSFELARRWRSNGNGRLEPTGELLSHVPPQVLFVERCVSLLRPGGRLGMVVPESLLSNKSYRYVVQFIQDRMRLKGIIGMPDALFKTSGKGGTHTKTCLVLADKDDAAAKRTKVFMAEAKWCGQDSRARAIPNNDLPAVLDNYRAFSSGKSFESSPLGFTLTASSIRDNVLCPRYYDPEIDNEADKLAETHDLVPFGRLLETGEVKISTGDEVGKLAYGTGTIPFIRTSDISNWELKADPKHGLDQETYDSLRHKQDVQPLDILMVRDGTYLVGTCAIVTEYDTQIVYQSHLFKIRVMGTDQRLNPYLLLALLSCSFVQRQIKAKRFTQDIIDSLGDRITELVLPIPRDERLRAAVTEMVKKSVYERVEAREIARQARIAVLGGTESAQVQPSAS